MAKIQLKGGAGRDTVLISISARTAAASRRKADVIEDFESGKDTIELSDLTFEQLSFEQGIGRRTDQLFIRNRDKLNKAGSAATVQKEGQRSLSSLISIQLTVNS